MPLGATVEVGIVARPHGVRGEVRVALHWDGSDALGSAPEVLLRLPRRGERRLAVVQARKVPKAVLLRLEGVESRDDAELLRGARVLVPREAMPALGPGEYYLCDLVGAELRGPEGPVGRVVEVIVHPASDVLRVELSNGGVAEQVLADAWVEAVDPEAGVVTLGSLDGLLLEEA